MTRDEHLLVIVMEECAELAQRASKALRFGLSEVQPEQALTNVERIVGEYSDLAGVMEMLNIASDPALAAAKRAKVEKFLAYSEACGTLTIGT